MRRATSAQQHSKYENVSEREDRKRGPHFAAPWLGIAILVINWLALGWRSLVRTARPLSVVYPPPVVVDHAVDGTNTKFSCYGSHVYWTGNNRPAPNLDPEQRNFLGPTPTLGCGSA